jgi:paraquat-inducible protein A
MSSLAERYPRDTIVLSLLWAIASLTLTAGLMLPAVRIIRFGLVDDTLSLISGIAELWRGSSWPLAIIVALFSVAFPIAKLALAAWLWFAPHAQRGAAHAFVAGASKWSMLDVLVVAIVIASMQGGFIVRLQPQAGIYLFGASAILSTLVTWLIDRRHRAIDHGP